MREEIADVWSTAGNTREQVYAYFVRKYGSQEPLASPIDEGFNRLAWLVPYTLGGAGAVGVALTARRWARKTAGPPVTGDDSRAAAKDPQLEERLDDELRISRLSRSSVHGTSSPRRASPPPRSRWRWRRGPVPKTSCSSPARSLAAGWVGAACHGALAPLLTPVRLSAQVVEGQARHRLEREKRLVLRSIKELEFDQAMGKVGEADFSDLSGRLRTRAIALMQRLERPQQQYRDRIEQEVRRRVTELAGPPAGAESQELPAPRARSGARLVDAV